MSAAVPRLRDRDGVLWPYYGGKWRAALRYPIPRSTVVEPFAGAAGYSLRWTQTGFRFDVHLYDLDDRVAALWRYLIRVSEEEVLALPDVPLGASVDDLPSSVCPEARLLIGWWIAARVAGSCEACYYLGVPERARRGARVQYVVPEGA